MSLSVKEILGPEGRIARRLKNYECRPQQLQMAEAVSSAIVQGHHLLAEAGTGVGKSFAYLVPAILATTAEHKTESTPRRIVVSTHTISLQEQLIGKDLPLLNSVIPREFSVVLVKGRGNYLSLRRLQNARQRAPNLLYSHDDIEELRDIVAWSGTTTDGSLSDLDFQPQRSVWDEVASDSGNCLGRKCPTFKKCFYYRARRRAKHAQILVVNHALFFSDLALRQVGVSILPKYDAVILDEAHTVEAVAGDHLGLRVGSGQVEYILNKLYNDRTNKGLLVHDHLREAQKETDDCRYLAAEFFGDIEQWLVSRPGHNGRIRAAGIVETDSARVSVS